MDERGDGTESEGAVKGKKEKGIEGSETGGGRWGVRAEEAVKARVRDAIISAARAALLDGAQDELLVHI